MIQYERSCPKNSASIQPIQLFVVLLCALVCSSAQGQEVSDSWTAVRAGGILTAFARGTNGTAIGVSCAGSELAVMFVFPRALPSGSLRLAYSADDANAKVIRGAAPDPMSRETFATVATPTSDLIRTIRRGSFLTFTSEDRSGQLMIGIVTLRGSSNALGRLPCVP